MALIIERVPSMFSLVRVIGRITRATYKRNTSSSTKEVFEEKVEKTQKLVLYEMVKRIVAIGDSINYDVCCF